METIHCLLMCIWVWMVVYLDVWNLPSPWERLKQSPREPELRNKPAWKISIGNLFCARLNCQQDSTRWEQLHLLLQTTTTRHSGLKLNFARIVHPTCTCVLDRWRENEVDKRNGELYREKIDREWARERERESTCVSQTRKQIVAILVQLVRLLLSVTSCQRYYTHTNRGARWQWGHGHKKKNQKFLTSTPSNTPPPSPHKPASSLSQ